MKSTNRSKMKFKKKFEVKIRGIEKELQENHMQTENLREKDRAQQTKIERLKNQKIEMKKEYENGLKELERQHNERIKTLGKNELKAAEKDFERQKHELLEKMDRRIYEQQENIDKLSTEVKCNKIIIENWKRQKKKRSKNWKNHKQLEYLLQKHKKKLESDWDKLE